MLTITKHVASIILNRVVQSGAAFNHLQLYWYMFFVEKYYFRQHTEAAVNEYNVAAGSSPILVIAGPQHEKQQQRLLPGLANGFY